MKHLVYRLFTGIATLAITLASFTALTINPVSATTNTSYYLSSHTSQVTNIKIVSSRLYVRHGATAYITIQTQPGAFGNIKVVYESGPSHAKGLYSQHADKAGKITWSWTVGTRTTKGNWPVYITVNHKTIEATLHVS